MRVRGSPTGFHVGGVRAGLGSVGCEAIKPIKVVWVIKNTDGLLVSDTQHALCESKIVDWVSAYRADSDASDFQEAKLLYNDARVQVNAWLAAVG